MSLLLSSSLLLLLVNVFSEINEEQIPDGENVTEEFTQTRNRIYFPCWSSFSSSSALSLTSFLPSSFAFTSYFFVIFFSLFLTSFFFYLRLLRGFFIFLYFSTYFPYSLSLNDSSFTSPSYFFVAFFILLTSFFNLSLLLLSFSFFFFFFPPILRVLTNFF